MTSGHADAGFADGDRVAAGGRVWLEDGRRGLRAGWGAGTFLAGSPDARGHRDRRPRPVSARMRAACSVALGLAQRRLELPTSALAPWTRARCARRPVRLMRSSGSGPGGGGLGQLLLGRRQLRGPARRSRARRRLLGAAQAGSAAVSASASLCCAATRSRRSSRMCSTAASCAALAACASSQRDADRPRAARRSRRRAEAPLGVSEACSWLQHTRVRRRRVNGTKVRFSSAAWPVLAGSHTVR